MVGYIEFQSSRPTSGGLKLGDLRPSNSRKRPTGYGRRRERPDGWGQVAERSPDGQIEFQISRPERVTAQIGVGIFPLS